MTTDIPAGTGPARTYAYVVDATTARSLARAGLRAQVRKPRFWAGPAVLTVGWLLISWGTRDWASLIVALVFLLVLPFLVHRSAVRLVRRVAPLGTRIETAFTDEDFTVRMLTSSSTQQFRGVHHLRRDGDGVTFRVGGSRLTQMLPAACFPDDEIARAVAAGASR